MVILTAIRTYQYQRRNIIPYRYTININVVIYNTYRIKNENLLSILFIQYSTVFFIIIITVVFMFT